MKLETLLSEKRSSILNKWLQGILETYPADSQRFFKKQKDPFANPVRRTLSEEIANLYHELFQEIDPERVSPILDRMIRVRAVQDFSPSRAISFIFLLKRIIRDELKGEIREKNLWDELSVWESSIDRLALIGFDIYMKRREKLYEIRANEANNQVSRLLVKAGLVSELPRWGPGHKEGSVT